MGLFLSKLMMMLSKYFIYVAFLLALGKQTQAQIGNTIPENRRVSWLGAGFKGCIPPTIPANRVKSIDVFGGNNDGTGDNTAAFNAVVASFGGASGVVLFGVGTYRFSSSLNLSSGIILRGVASTQTTLTFDFGGIINQNCINISTTNSGVFTGITAGANKGSGAITVANVAGFAPNGYVEIRQDNTFATPDAFATKCVGQIVEIDNVVGNVISLRNTLRLNFTGTNLEARPINYIEKVGIESLKIERTDSPVPSGGGGNNVYCQYAINCWVKDVESAFSMGAHILAEFCSRLDISGCYFHEALLDYKGSSTRGYGVCLNLRTGDCLVENNIFRKLRHAMMVQAGANGNVFAYNYARETYRNGSGEIPTDAAGDIVCHGYYPFANLFEGNVVNNVVIDNENGINGPFNTFFRNKALLYGLGFSFTANTSISQNFVGNEFTGIIGGFNLDQSADSFKHGNATSSGITPVGTGTLPDKTYYRSYKPESLGNENFPSVGTPKIYNTGSNAAAVRWNFVAKKTIAVNFGSPVLTLGTPVNQTVSISTATPAAAYSWSNAATGTSIAVSQTGVYTLSISNDNQCTVSGNITVLSLPIELIYFKANVSENQSIVTEWATLSEKNTKEFVLEKSRNLLDFEEIARLDAFGNSQNRRIYTYEDTKPWTGQSYYRLKQIDLDGSQQVFRPVAVTFNNSDFSVFPNPNINQGFYVKSNTVAQFTLFNSSGQAIGISVQKSDNQYFIKPIALLSKGMYYLRIEENGLSKIKKIVFL